MISVARYASIGTEREDPDVSIALRGESGDLLVVAHAADQDRPIAEPNGVTGHARVEGERDYALRRADRRAGRLHVRQRHAGDRLVAQRIEPFRWIAKPTADLRRLGQRCQRVKPLTDPVAEPAGTSPLHLGLEELLRPDRSRDRFELTGLFGDLLALVVIDLGRDGRTDGQDRCRQSGGDVGGG